jgi:hypothetical protein
MSHEGKKAKVKTLIDDLSLLQAKLQTEKLKLENKKLEIESIKIKEEIIAIKIKRRVLVFTLFFTALGLLLKFKS